MTYGNDKKIAESWVSAEAEKLKYIRSIINDASESIGVDMKLTRDLVLAVNEACMNIIQHAYHNKPNRKIHLMILRGESSISFIIEDDAPCVEQLRIQSRSLNEIRPGGLGVYLINTIMDEVRYEECKRRGNRLILTKYL